MIDHTLFDLRVSRTARRLYTYQIVPALAWRSTDGRSDIWVWPNQARPKRGVKQNLHGMPYKTRLRFVMLLGLARLVEIAFVAMSPKGKAHWNPTPSP
jgi:hypothetical protein